MTARDLQGRRVTWVTSQMAELVSRSVDTILLFEERPPPLLGQAADPPYEMHLHQASSPPAQGLLWHLEFSPGEALLGVLQLSCPTYAPLKGTKASQTGSKNHMH